jgi:hypothetical protein
MYVFMSYLYVFSDKTFFIACKTSPRTSYFLVHIFHYRCQLQYDIYTIKEFRKALET